MRAPLPSLGLLLSLGAASLAACGDPSSGSGSGPPGATSSSTSAAPAKPREPLAAPERGGGALMRSADGARLYLADEDHKVLRILPLPFAAEPEVPPAPAGASGSASASAAPSGTAAAGSAAPSGTAAAGSAAPSGSAYAGPGGSGKPRVDPNAPKPPPAPTPGVVSTVSPYPPTPPAQQIEVPMPGRPAQIVAMDGFVLVTIRDPGMLLVLKELPGNKLEEEGRVPLAADAWGLAITRDEKLAVVTSAWTHTVTGVDWRAHKALWTTDVAREPRGVAIHPNGKTAYVSHLTSGDLTRIDEITTTSPRVKKVPLPAAPTRTPQGAPMPASLGYALVIDDAGNRLLAARHALGALGPSSWYGAATVDVLQTANDQPLLAPRVPDKRIQTTPAFNDTREERFERNPDRESWELRPFVGPDLSLPGFVQPRAMILSHRRGSVWLASEGADAVAELSVRSAAPLERPVHTVHVGRHYRDQKVIGDGSGDSDGIPTEGGAPTGLALSADETLLYVFCRSTYDLVTVRIAKVSPEKGYEPLDVISGMVVARVAQDSLDDAMSRGRRLFLGGQDRYSSGGMGCAGCHPEGRDDGHVWHEVITDEAKHEGNFFGTQYLGAKTNNGNLGYPRQTPMLAGRVGSAGPYGWHAQNESLTARLAEGFNRHRWGGGWGATPTSWMVGERANGLAEYLRKGLVPPPKPARDLTEQEKLGKQIFESDATKCKQCHTPEFSLGSNIAYPLKKVTPPAGYEEEADDKYKAPSLFFVGGTAPYYHDGSVPTLEALIAKNGDRMGNTSQLSPAEKAALVAYLETL